MKFLLITTVAVSMVSCDLVGIEKKDEEITKLEDAKTRQDTIYVIDNWNYSERGNRKPACSMSPDYNGCMQSRIENLGINFEM